MNALVSRFLSVALVAGFWTSPAFAASIGGEGGVDPAIYRLMVFVMAIFVGYYVVWERDTGVAHAADERDQRDLVGHCCRSFVGGRCLKPCWTAGCWPKSLASWRW